MSAPQPKLILLMGIPASGKSTFASRHFADDCVRISLDALHTRKREARMFLDALAARRDIVVDNTNVTRDERRRFIGPAKEAGYWITGYFLKSVLDECLRRNSLRTGKGRIPDVGVVSRFKALELPDAGEGFDELYYVSMEDGDFSIDEWRNGNEEE